MLRDTLDGNRGKVGVENGERGMVEMRAVLQTGHKQFEYSSKTKSRKHGRQGVRSCKKRGRNVRGRSKETFEMSLQ